MLVSRAPARSIFRPLSTESRLQPAEADYDQSFFEWVTRLEALNRHWLKPGLRTQDATLLGPLPVQALRQNDELPAFLSVLDLYPPLHDHTFSFDFVAGQNIIEANSTGLSANPAKLTERDFSEFFCSLGAKLP